MYPSDIMTVGELADYLRCHQSTIYRMLKRREIPGAFRVSTDWRFRRDAIVEWTKKMGVEKRDE